MFGEIGASAIIAVQLPCQISVLFFIVKKACLPNLVPCFRLAFCIVPVYLVVIKPVITIIIIITSFSLIVNTFYSAGAHMHNHKNRRYVYA